MANLQQLVDRARRHKPGAAEALVKAGHIANPVTAFDHCPGCKALADLAGLKESEPPPGWVGP